MIDDENPPIKIHTLLQEFKDRKKVWAKLTLSSGEELVCSPIFDVDPEDECVPVEQPEEGMGERWIVIAHIVSLQDWIFD